MKRKSACVEKQVFISLIGKPNIIIMKANIVTIGNGISAKMFH